jgi:hypothetical protein
MGWDLISATNRPIVQPPGDIWAWRPMVEWYWQEKPKKSEKPFPTATLSTENLKWTDPGANPGLSKGRLFYVQFSDC